MLKKNCQVFMVSTNERALPGDLWCNTKTDAPRYIHDENPNPVNTLTGMFPKDYDIKNCFIPAYCIKQHLYIVSDERIKDGDWFLETTSGMIWQRKNSNVYSLPEDAKKIIATTNKILSSKGVFESKFREKEDLSFDAKLLPEPPPEFIEKYINAFNSGKPITKVVVDYEETMKWHLDDYDVIEKLKIDKNNYISIHAIVKDNYTREEILEALNDPYGAGSVNRDEYRQRVLTKLGLD